MIGRVHHTLCGYPWSQQVMIVSKKTTSISISNMQQSKLQSSMV